MSNSSLACTRTSSSSAPTFPALPIVWASSVVWVNAAMARVASVRIYAPPSGAGRDVRRDGGRPPRQLAWLVLRRWRARPAGRSVSGKATHAARSRSGGMPASLRQARMNSCPCVMFWGLESIPAGGESASPDQREELRTKNCEQNDDNFPYQYLGTIPGRAILV